MDSFVYICCIVANALFFPVSEIVKNFIAERKNIPTTELALHHRLIAGACAGICYWVSRRKFSHLVYFDIIVSPTSYCSSFAQVGMYPLDAIKGNSQATPYLERRGWYGTVRRMWYNGGIASFTKGFWACAARALPACSVMFTTVDIVRENLGDLLLKQQRQS